MHMHMHPRDETADHTDAGTGAPGAGFGYLPAAPALPSPVNMRAKPEATPSTSGSCESTRVKSAAIAPVPMMPQRTLRPGRGASLLPLCAVSWAASLS